MESKFNIYRDKSGRLYAHDTEDESFWSISLENYLGDYEKNTVRELKLVRTQVIIDVG